MGSVVQGVRRRRGSTCSGVESSTAHRGKGGVYIQKTADANQDGPVVAQYCVPGRGDLEELRVAPEALFNLRPSRSQRFVLRLQLDLVNLELVKEPHGVLARSKGVR
jgi:hypothetical protein